MAKQSSGRPWWHVALTIAAWALLALSLVVCGIVTWDGLKFAHQVTCEPPPPVAFRQTIVFTGLGLNLASMLPAAFLVARGKLTGTIVGLLLACIAIAVSFFTLLIPLFSAAMC